MAYYTADKNISCQHVSSFGLKPPHLLKSHTGGTLMAPAILHYTAVLSSEPGGAIYKKMTKIKVLWEESDLPFQSGF